MTVRFVCLLLALGACTPAQAPKARRVGKVMSLGGVGGLIATAFATRITGSNTIYVVDVFSVISAVGISTYAAGDLARPPPIQETVTERHHRWAQILTERAVGAARSGACPRVRWLETRVRSYDRDIHDVVFMRDPAIVKCMTEDQVPEEPPPVTDDASPL